MYIPNYSSQTGIMTCNFLRQLLCYTVTHTNNRRLDMDILIFTYVILFYLFLLGRQVSVISFCTCIWGVRSAQRYFESKFRDNETIKCGYILITYYRLYSIRTFFVISLPTNTEIVIIDVFPFTIMFLQLLILYDVKHWIIGILIANYCLHPQVFLKIVST